MYSANAAVFSVSPGDDTDCSDFTCTFQSALTAAETNNQDNTLLLASETYPVTATMTYRPVTNSRSLAIQGAGANATILDGGGSVQILHVDTTGIANDVDADITVSDIGMEISPSQVPL